MSSEAARQRAAELEMRERVRADFASLSAGHVIATVVRCHQTMRRIGLRGDELIAATELLARTRLTAGQSDRSESVPPRRVSRRGT